jgi:Glycosyltransferase family 87
VTDREEQPAEANAGPPRLSARFVAITALAAAAGFVIAYVVVVWLVAQHFYTSSGRDSDVGFFQSYATSLLHGQLPYRDFTYLYPPGALPVFVVPAWLAGTAYDANAYFAAFQAVMLAIGAVMVLLAVLTLSRVTNRRSDVLVGAALLAASPLLLGQVMVTRYDLWPAALTVATLLSASLARYRVAAVLLGLAVLAKVYPIVLLPLLAAFVWQHARRREAAIFVALTFGTIGLGFAPFLLADAGSVIDAMARAFDRSLQVESLGAAILIVLHDTIAEPITVTFGGGSHNLIGSRPDEAISIQSFALAVMLLVVWIRFARGPADLRALIVAAAAAIAIYVGLGRVLSDQYVIWLIPLVAMIPGGAGRIAALWLAAILAASSWIYPGAYAAFERDLNIGVASVVLARVLAIVLLGVFLAWRVGIGRVRTARVRSPEPARAPGSRPEDAPLPASP